MKTLEEVLEPFDGKPMTEETQQQLFKALDDWRDETGYHVWAETFIDETVKTKEDQAVTLSITFKYAPKRDNNATHPFVLA